MVSLTSLSPRKISVICWLLLFMMPMVGMAIDLFAPSLPAITKDLSVSSSLVQGLISLFLLGYALGNFISGFLTNAWGRKNLLCGSMAGFIVVVLIPPLYPHIATMLVMRFLQGLTFGAMVVVIRAIFSDLLSPEALVKQGTWIGTMWGLGPVLGPVIGGYLQFYLGWQSCFYFMALLCLLTLLSAVWIIPETSTARHRLDFSTMSTHMMEVLRHRVFMGLTLIMGMMYALLVTFQTSGPFLIQTVLGYSPVFFGHLALLLGLAFLLATFVCRALLKRWSMDTLLFGMLMTFSVIAVLSFLISIIAAKNLLLIAISNIAMFFACGFIFPLSMGKGMHIAKQMSAVAIAMMYLINICLTSFVAFVLSFFHIKNAILLTTMDSILLLLALAIYYLMVRGVGVRAY